MPPPSRPTYTHPQIAKYFDRLRLPANQRIYDVNASLNPDEALAYLALLQKLHLASIPFENLSLHYSPHRHISIHPEAVFQKIIGNDGGRGGYCMENTGLFSVLLHSLGFDCYSAGARVFSENLNGWGHMIVIVKIGGQKYHVDVGFGPNGPIVPMPLHRNGTVQPNVPPSSSRLQWKNIPQNTDPDQRLWVYEHRIDENADFNMAYCFTELEFLPADYAVMNLSTSTSPNIFFTQMVFMEKKLLGEDGEIEGSIILAKSVKWRIRGKKDREIEFMSEEDRVGAVEEHFGIKLSVVERDSIAGMVSQIK